MNKDRNEKIENKRTDSFKAARRCGTYLIILIEFSSDNSQKTLDNDLKAVKNNSPIMRDSTSFLVVFGVQHVIFACVFLKS